MQKFVVDFLDRQIFFETDSSLFIKMMAKYNALPVSEYPSKIFSFRLFQEKNRFVAEDNPHKERFYFDDERKAVIFCGSLFLSVCAQRLHPECSMFHGAGVSRGKDAYMIMGDSGAGKTTLALSLLSEGFKLLSDDLSILEMKSNFILPLKIKAAIDKNSPFAANFARDMFKESWNNSKIYAPLTDMFNEAFWSRASRLKAIFFLEKSGSRKTDVQLLTRHEGFKKLCHFYIYSRKDLKMIIERNCKIIKNVNCYKVKRGELADTIKAVKKVILEAARC